MISLGLHPDISLKEARVGCNEVRTMVARGVNPSEERQKVREKRKGTLRFSTIVKEWFKTNESSWTKDHAQKLWRRLKVHILPWLGKEKNQSTHPLHSNCSSSENTSTPKNRARKMD